MDDDVKHLRTLFDKTIKQISTPLGSELTAAGHALTTALTLADSDCANLEDALQSAHSQAQRGLTPDDESALQRTIIFEWLDAQLRRHNLEALQTIHAVLPQGQQLGRKARGNAKELAESIGHAIETAPNKRAEPAARKRLDTAWRAIGAHSRGQRTALIDITRRAQAETRTRVRKLNAKRETLAMSVALAGLAGLDINIDASTLFQRARKATNTEWETLPDSVRRNACNIGEEAQAIFCAEQLLDDGWIHTDNDWSPPVNTDRMQSMSDAKKA